MNYYSHRYIFIIQSHLARQWNRALILKIIGTQLRFQDSTCPSRLPCLSSRRSLSALFCNSKSLLRLYTHS